MHSYKIDFIEDAPTKSGIMKCNATVTDETGVQTENVTLWLSSWPNLKELKPGSVLAATLEVKVNGQYTNKTLYPQKTDTLKRTQAPAWAKAKEKSIEKAQENKQEGIKVSSTFRDATLVTIAFFQGIQFTEEQFRKKWVENREWLWKQFDFDDTQLPPF